MKAAFLQCPPYGNYKEFNYLCPMRSVGTRVRICSCAWLLLSYALLLYSASYGRVEIARYQRATTTMALVKVGLPSDSYVGAATQRVERIQPLVFSAKCWWVMCNRLTYTTHQANLECMRGAVRHIQSFLAFPLQAKEVLRL